MPKWFDDGVRVNLAVSESGDFVAVGNRTEFPFVAGGAGIPSGWSQLVSGGVAGDVNWTTANGRFSVSNISTTNSNTNKLYGIYRDFPVTYGKRYVLWVQARTMENKAGGVWQITYSFNNDGTFYGFHGDSANDWDQATCYMLPTSSSHTFIRVRLMVWYPGPAPGQNERFDWGLQWQLPAMVEYNSTYPDPTWHDVTCDVQSFQVAYGRSKFTGRFDVASAQIGVVNVDAEFTYQPVHPWGLRPGRFVKVTVTEPQYGLVYPAFYGLIDSIADSFPIDGKNTAVLNCIDTSSLLSNSLMTSSGSPGSTALSGIRWRSILDNMAWNPSMRSFNDGVYYQQAVLSNGRTVRDELGLIADSEGGYFWCDRSGIVTYRDRNYIKNNERCNSVYAELVAECPTYVDEVIFKFPGVNGNGMTVPYSSGLEGSYVTVIAALTFDNISSASRQVIAGQDGRWEFRKVGGSKKLEFNNGSGYATSTIDLPINSGEYTNVRVTYNKAAATVTFYYSVGGNWVQLGAVVSITGTMPTNTNPIRIGGNGSTFLMPLAATVTSVRIGNGLGDWLYLNRDMVPGTAGQVVLSLPTGQQVTVVQTAPNVIVQNDPTIEPHRLIPVDNIPTVGTAVVQHLKALGTDWSRDRVINDIQIASVGGSAFQSVDYVSQSRYGPRTYQRLDFLNDNAHPEYNLERTNDFMAGFTESILRVDNVTLVPDVDTYSWVLSMWLLDLVRVRYQHPTEGWGFAVATRIQGYAHSLTTQGWTTTLNLDQPLSFVFWATPPNESTGWDTDFWDVGIWDNADPSAAYWTSGQVWSDSQSKWSA